jgi:serine/threonine protein kinase
MAFFGNTAAVIHDGILNRTPTPVRHANPNLPPELERIVNKALEKDRKLRYQNASDIRSDLQRLKRDTESARAPRATSELPRVRERQGIRWGIVIPAAMAVVALSSGSYLYFHRTGNTAPKNDHVAIAPIQSEKRLARENPKAQVEQSNDFSESGIRTLLSAWTESFKEKDLARQVDCYAPVLETYFLRHKVPREFVQANKSKAFDAIKEVRIFEIGDVTLEFTSSATAIVKLRKKWDTGLRSGKSYAGEEIEQLQLANLDGDWKIVSEKELKVLWVDRHS